MKLSAKAQIAIRAAVTVFNVTQCYNSQFATLTY